MAEWLSSVFSSHETRPESMVDVRVEYLVGGLEHEFYDFPYIGNFIIATDFHSDFSKG